MSEPDDPYAAPDPNANPNPDPNAGFGAPGYGPPPGQPPYPPQQPGQAGYGPPPGQPPYGQPPYGQPGYGQPGWYPQSRKTNGLAIASLICSCAAFVVCVSAPVGAILGFVALNQIKRTGEEGRGLALAGAWIGTIFTVVAVLGAAIVIALVAWFADDVNDACQREDYFTEQEYQDCVERHLEDRFGALDRPASGPAHVPTVFAA